MGPAGPTCCLRCMAAHGVCYSHARCRPGRSSRRAPERRSLAARARGGCVSERGCRLLSPLHVHPAAGVAWMRGSCGQANADDKMGSPVTGWAYGMQPPRWKCWLCVFMSSPALVHHCCASIHCRGSGQPVQLVGLVSIRCGGGRACPWPQDARPATRTATSAAASGRIATRCAGLQRTHTWTWTVSCVEMVVHTRGCELHPLVPPRYVGAEVYASQSWHVPTLILRLPQSCVPAAGNGSLARHHAGACRA